MSEQEQILSVQDLESHDYANRFESTLLRWPNGITRSLDTLRRFMGFPGNGGIHPRLAATGRGAFLYHSLNLALLSGKKYNAAGSATSLEAGDSQTRNVGATARACAERWWPHRKSLADTGTGALSLSPGADMRSDRPTGFSQYRAEEHGIQGGALPSARSLPLSFSSTEGLSTFKIYFDGGDSGQWAYGSWEIEFLGFKVRRHRIKFLEFTEGVKTSSNCAEYLALLGALDWLQGVKDKRGYLIEIFGDSKLVIEQINKRWKCKCDHLAVLRDRARKALSEFAGFKAHWHGRHHNVIRFGH